MRNYIENESGIIPFDKIVELMPYSSDGQTGVKVFTIDKEESVFYDKNYQEELTAFKAWLKAQESTFIRGEVAATGPTETFKTHGKTWKQPKYEGRAMECANHGRTPDSVTNWLSVCTGCGNCMGCGCICHD